MEDTQKEKVFRYGFFKLFHLIGVVLWLGPSTGAYYMIIFSMVDEQRSIELWLRQHYISFVHFELLGLFLIIASGLLMILAMQGALLRQWWLKMKIYIAGIIFIPLEAIQLYLYHVRMNKAFKTGMGIREATALFDWFSVVAIVLLTLTVPAIFVLGVFKPEKKRTAVIGENAESISNKE
jgi:hypothetical protein